MDRHSPCGECLTSARPVGIGPGDVNRVVGPAVMDHRIPVVTMLIL